MDGPLPPQRVIFQKHIYKKFSTASNFQNTISLTQTQSSVPQFATQTHTLIPLTNLTACVTLPSWKSLLIQPLL